MGILRFKNHTKHSVCNAVLLRCFSRYLWSSRKFELFNEVHITLFYWFKTRTWQRRSNRACAKDTRKPGKQQTWRLILRWRKCNRFIWKSVYFQRWLKYSNAFEASEVIGKLNIVLSSWKTFEDFFKRKYWTTYTCIMNQSCNKNVHVGQAQVQKLIEPKTPWTRQSATCLEENCSKKYNIHTDTV